MRLPPRRSGLSSLVLVLAALATGCAETTVIRTTPPGAAVGKTGSLPSASDIEHYVDFGR